MFKVTSERLVKSWPAVVEVPVDGGAIEKHNITLDLLILDTEENGKVLNGDKKALKKIIKGWSGIGDKHGKEMPFNEENLEATIRNQFFVIAVYRAYTQASNGQAAEKN
ncbi:hypothetical protein [Vibrio navarrensis]|uniref:hypothetical protein n=1 Tax=Vibrio navarrensis TaxID=29495 RepID=UPI001302C717|nr:hypothetical protein [Vibrio navarrensis]MBE3653498.1 hypothetical protein [Vibrio navarrensis]